MAKPRRRVRLGLVLVSSGLLLCCVMPALAFDPLLNAVVFGGTARPSVPAYPTGQGPQRRVERRGLNVHTVTIFQTAEDRARVLDFYDRGLGPPNGKWRRTDTAHYPPNPRIARTWVYHDYCPGTLVDLTFAPVVIGEFVVAGLTEVEVRVTEYSCRDRWVVVVLGNLVPPLAPHLPK